MTNGNSVPRSGAKQKNIDLEFLRHSFTEIVNSNQYDMPKATDHG